MRDTKNCPFCGIEMEKRVDNERQVKFECPNCFYEITIKKPEEE